MPHYNFSWTKSNLRKDMLKAIKELFLLKNVREIELNSDNAILIRELNGMELEKVIVTNIKLKDEELFYKAQNPKGRDQPRSSNPRYSFHIIMGIPTSYR